MFQQIQENIFVTRNSDNMEKFVNRESFSVRRFNSHKNWSFFSWFDHKTHTTLLSMDREEPNKTKMIFFLSIRQRENKYFV